MRHSQSSRYDTRTTIFSREGRLHQIEYAIEAISKAGPAVGIMAEDGIVLAAGKRVGSALLDIRSATERLYTIDANIACAVAGITSDAHTLIDTARTEAQRYLSTYQEQAPVEHIVTRLCSLKHSYTQFGGLRPFGASFLLAGWDRQQGFQLYHTDPSGNYSGWKAKPMGANAAAAQGVLTEAIKEGDKTLPDLAKAKEIAAKALSKAMDATLTSDKIEIAVLTKRADSKGAVYTVLPVEELKPLLEKVSKEIEEEKAKEGAGDI